MKVLLFIGYAFVFSNYYDDLFNQFLHNNMVMVLNYRRSALTFISHPFPNITIALS